MGWDVMKLHGINKCQCYSHTVGLHEVMAPDEIRWDYLTKPKGSTAHILLVIGLFDSWEKPQVTVTNLLLGCDETCHDQSKGQMATHMLFITGHETYGQKEIGAVSHTVGYGVKHNTPSAQKWREGDVTHILLVIWPDNMTLPDGTKGQHLLTGCWL